MRLLGRPAETAVLPQDPDAPAERSPGRLLAVEAGRPVRVRHEDGHARLAADLIHPARTKTNRYTTHKSKKELAGIKKKKKKKGTHRINQNSS